MHPDSSHAWIYEKLRLQLYSYHARTENSENSTFTYSLNLSSLTTVQLYRYSNTTRIQTYRPSAFPTVDAVRTVTDIEGGERAE